MSLIVENLGFTSETGRILLRDLSFTLEPGQCLAVTGADKTGKSLLLKIVSGLLEPGEGTVCYRGIDLHNAQDDTLHELRREIGFLFSGTGLLANLNIEENLMLPVRHYIPADRFPEYRERMLQILNDLGLAGIHTLRPAEISLARCKMAAFVRMLLLEPSLVFLDSPLFNLGLAHQRRFLNYWNTLPLADRIVVTVTDSPELIRNWANSLLVLESNGTHHFVPRSSFDQLETILISESEGFTA
jgi:ABC-type lipoprotein export system ATPase subunit